MPIKHLTFSSNDIDRIPAYPVPLFLSDWLNVKSKKLLESSCQDFQKDILPRLEILLISRDQNLLIKLKSLFSELAGNYCVIDWVYEPRYLLHAFSQSNTDLIIYDLRYRKSSDVLDLASSNDKITKLPLLYICDRKTTDKVKESLSLSVNDFIVDSEITATLLERVVRYLLSASTLTNSNASNLPQPLFYSNNVVPKKPQNGVSEIIPSVLNGLPYPLFCKDRNNVYIGCNQHFAQLLGLLPKNIVGKTNAVLPWQNPDAAKQLEDMEQQVIESKTPTSKVIEIETTPSGIRKWLQVDIVPLRSSQNGVCGVTCSMQDISIHRRTQMALRTTEARMRLMLEQIPALIWTVDKELNVSLCSKASLSVFGNNSKFCAVKLSVYDLFQDEGSKDAPVIMAKRALLGESLSCQLSHKGITYQVRMEPIQEANGRIIAAIGLAAEISISTQISHNNTKAKSESLRQFAGGIAKDFNKTLINIIGELSLISSSATEDSNLSKRIQKIKSSVDHASNITKQLLLYGGRTASKRTRIRINLIVEDVRRNLRHSMPDGVQFSYQLADTLPMISGDAQLIRQCLINLITNSIESIIPRTGKVLIKTGFGELHPFHRSNSITGIDMKSGSYVFLEVGDNGKGFSENLQHRIFDPYFTTKLCNRGLGLTTVLGIMREHEGGIFVKTNKDKGSIFRLVFPVTFV